MACIDCGLGVNADGKGRVDLDLDGGLECSGGAGGLSNTKGNGLKIKLDDEPGNGASLSFDGLYVPRRFDLETYYASAAGTDISDPNFPSGGTYQGAEASINLSNGTDLDKVYAIQGYVAWGTVNTTVGVWMELEMNTDGTWFTPAAISLTAGNIVSPLVSHVFFVSVAPDVTKTIRARMRLYTGNLGVYNVQISAWGGHSE